MLDLFLYGNVLLTNGKSERTNFGCVQCRGGARRRAILSYLALAGAHGPVGEIVECWG